MRLPAAGRMAARLAVLLLATILVVACGDAAPRLGLAADARIVAFGDSLTRGTGAAPGQGYPEQLAALGPWQVINEGVPGETSDQGLARIDAVLARHRPSLVILWHGGNDILANRDPADIEHNLRAMVDAIHAAGARVLLLGVPEKSLLLSTAPWYPRIAESLDLPYLDDVLGEVLRDRALKADSVHPNTAGYAVIAERVHAALR